MLLPLLLLLFSDLQRHITLACNAYKRMTNLLTSGKFNKVFLMVVDQSTHNKYIYQSKTSCRMEKKSVTWTRRRTRARNEAQSGTHLDKMMIMVNAVNTIPPVLITLSHANARFSLSPYFGSGGELRSGVKRSKGSDRVRKIDRMRASGSTAGKSCVKLMKIYKKWHHFDVKDE